MGHHELTRACRANDQKLFYWLLYNHREAQLENYNNNVPISKSDIHHLKPPNWKKRIATCEFTHSGRNGQGKNVTKFTVISNVPEVDDSGTVYSYDPYNASRNLQPCASQVSHARITVHRKDDEIGTASKLPVVSRSYHSYRTVGSSFRGRRRMDSQRTGATASHVRSPHSTMNSIRSIRNTPRSVVNSRGKRGVDFSNIRSNSGQRGGGRHSREPEQIVTVDKKDETATNGLRTVSASASQTDTFKVPSANSCRGQHSKDPKVAQEESMVWNEELQMLGHRIAEDCDKAFQSSLVLSESGADEDSRDITPYSASLGTFSTGRLLELSSLDPTPKARPWDNRPLPPTPTGTITPASSTWNRGAVNIEPIPLNLRQPSDRRTVSEPLYSLFPKPQRGLPSIYEN
jgi:serine/threonine-protein kinase HSL1, negative regulator of Swe1 kinase